MQVQLGPPCCHPPQQPRLLAQGLAEDEPLTPTHQSRDKPSWEMKGVSTLPGQAKEEKQSGQVAPCQPLAPAQLVTLSPTNQLLEF